MLIAPILTNETQRLESLYQYNLLDTSPEVDYDRVSHIASQLCQTPIAMVSLIDRERQWVKSSYGITIDNIPREVSLCAHTILYEQPLMVGDTKEDDRFWDNPAVTGPPHIIFYVGIPLMSSDGFAIGSLCVIDHYPRQLTASQRMTLQALADQVVLLMELRRTNSQLRLARTQAEELARQKAHLLATLSHEIRTPLNALEGYTQLLLEQQNNLLPDQQNSLLRLQTIGRTTVSLVNNILDYSKLQAGKLVLEAIPFSVSELIQQVVDMQAWQARQKNLRLITRIDPELPDQLQGDATRLLQILLNLVSNALKFTDRGEVCVWANVISREASAVTLNIEVSDTGIGIAAASLGLLFNEYTQVSAATTRLYGGSGLGLAITRQLLDLMGSTLQVQSQEGKGSRFGFQLTLPTVAAFGLPPAINWTQGLLLAVDDSPFNTKVLARLINQHGGRIAVFNSPLEALEAARHTAYRGILLDLHMPELDGYELARRLQPLQPGVPLIALSADDSTETLEQVRAAGFSGFVRKPFLPQQLVHSLTELV